MDSVARTVPNGGVVVCDKENNDYASMVDPFLVEALQNSRHRLTILRMELDIQKFLQNSDQQLFELQHYPTSYLRLAAHRVAQHYGLQSMVQDNMVDGLGSRIIVQKSIESGYPAVTLSEVPAKELERDKNEQIKIVLRPRLNKDSANGGAGVNRSPVRTVEERKEEYDRARARIFSSTDSEDFLGHATLDGKDGGGLNEGFKDHIFDLERNNGSRDGGTTSRVAIFRDREKDRTDPDYDRSYGRYVKSTPANQGFSTGPFNMQQFHPPLVQYDTAFHQVAQMPRTQAPLSYGTPLMSPFQATGFNHTSTDTFYMQWPASAMMYAHPYDQFRHAVFQAPYSQQQQPLSFDYTQNHH